MARPLDWTVRTKHTLIKGLVTFCYISCASTTIVVEPIVIS